MLRPSRPMIRPFISSFGSSISRVVVSEAWLAGEPLGRDREDVAGAAVGVALRLLLDLQERPAPHVASVVFDVGDQHLLGLADGQARQPLELAALDLLLPLELLGLRLEVALAVGERPLATLDLGCLQALCFELMEGELLEPGELATPGLELVRAPVVDARRRVRRRGLPRAEDPSASSLHLTSPAVGQSGVVIGTALSERGGVPPASTSSGP